MVGKIKKETMQSFKRYIRFFVELDVAYLKTCDNFVFVIRQILFV